MSPINGLHHNGRDLGYEHFVPDGTDYSTFPAINTMRLQPTAPRSLVQSESCRRQP